MGRVWGGVRGVKGINSSAVMTGGIIGLVDARDIADWTTAGTPTPQILLHSLAEWNSPGCLGHPCVIVQNFGGPLQGHTPDLVKREGQTPFAFRSSADSSTSLLLSLPW